MSLSLIQKQVFRILKGAGIPLSLPSLAYALKVRDPDRGLLQALAELVQAGYLTEKEGKYWIRIYLDPPLKKEQIGRHVGEAWEYESIQQELPGGGERAPTFRNPFEKYLPHGWSQNGRGTCTGHSGAIQMQCNYYACTKDFPTDEEMAQAKSDQRKDLGSCILVYDQWYRTVFSAQWCYHIGRVHGNVQYPSGGYTKSVVEAMRKYGAVPWDTCLTPKIPNCAPLTYPLSFEETKELATRHKIDGFAVVTTFEGVMDAIEKSPSHCVNMATNLEEDYQHPSPGDIWKAHPGSPKAGSHALAWVFVDRERGLIGCWNSWGNTEYPQTCWIDKRFWQENCSPGYVVLDTDEVLIGKEIFVKVILKSNVPTRFFINDGMTLTEYQGSEVTLSLERGIPYEIEAYPQDDSTTIEPVLNKNITFGNEAGDQVLEFRFTVKIVVPPPTPPDVGWIARLFAKIAEILGRLKK